MCRKRETLCAMGGRAAGMCGSHGREREGCGWVWTRRRFCPMQGSLLSSKVFEADLILCFRELCLSHNGGLWQHQRIASDAIDNQAHQRKFPMPCAVFFLVHAHYLALCTIFFENNRRHGFVTCISRKPFILTIANG